MGQFVADKQDFSITSTRKWLLLRNHRFTERRQNESYRSPPTRFFKTFAAVRYYHLSTDLFMDRTIMSATLGRHHSCRKA